MKDPRIDGLAKVIVGYSLELKEGQTFFISSGAVAEPLVQALYEEVLRAGANPVLNLALEGTQPAFFEHASDAQLEWISPTQQWAFDEADARIADPLRHQHPRALQRPARAADPPPEGDAPATCRG